MIFDGSCAGRNCITLVASIVYKKRALPIAWIVRQGAKGHFPEALHLELAQRVQQIIPADTKVIFLGNGEFDGADLITLVKSFGWFFVYRAAKNRKLLENDDVFSPRMIGVGQDGYFEIPNVYLENDPSPGLIHLIVCWKYTYEEPIDATSASSSSG